MNIVVRVGIVVASIFVGFFVLLAPLDVLGFVVILSTRFLAATLIIVYGIRLAGYERD